MAQAHIAMSSVNRWFERNKTSQAQLVAALFDPLSVYLSTAIPAGIVDPAL
ncbi:MAG: hypothetical protein AAF722_08055 [Cyanobacteria bacterium P01_C01_bin.70]